jgi:hypothetical protein
MTANRILASVACLPLLAAAVFGQSYPAPQPSTSWSQGPQTGDANTGWPAPSSLFPGKGGGLRYASDSQVVPAPLPPGTNPPGPTPTDTLTGAPLPMVPDAVPGAVYSPWCGDTPAGGCCGPVGANGPVGFDLFFRTGPSLISGGGEFARTLKTFGWNVQGGGRTLFFNPAGDSAWALDLGVGYTNIEGRSLSRPVDVLSNAVKFGGPGGQPTFAAGVRELRRTSFNFGVGRDHFLNGPGWVGADCVSNFRLGWDVGGRWGTASVDYEPFLEPGGYRRLHDIFHGVYLAGQGTWEQPMGAWTFYLGGRVEWGYYWTNLIPPNDGDFRDVNLLLLAGVRF